MLDGAGSMAERPVTRAPPARASDKATVVAPSWHGPPTSQAVMLRSELAAGAGGPVEAAKLDGAHDAVSVDEGRRDRWIGPARRPIDAARRDVEHVARQDAVQRVGHVGGGDRRARDVGGPPSACEARGEVASRKTTPASPVRIAPSVPSDRPTPNMTMPAPSTPALVAACIAHEGVGEPDQPKGGDGGDEGAGQDEQAGEDFEGSAHSAGSLGALARSSIAANATAARKPKSAIPKATSRKPCEPVTPATRAARQIARSRACPSR